MGYNAYRKRSYNRSKSQNRSYAEEMSELASAFEELSLDGWSISSRLDSAYKYFEILGIELRLSNHSAENPYHDLSGERGFLLVNVKMSKRDFVKFIGSTTYEMLLNGLADLDLSRYRFINVVGVKVNCYLKGYKTKKEVFIMDWSVK